MLNEEGWVVIEDRSRWVIPLEKINPADENRYISYWKEHKRRVIEGHWAQDWGEYRYMPPTLYFYGNFSIIIDTDHKTKQRKKIKPLVRDLEWELAYGMLVAKGFSGFKDDEDRTCNVLALTYKAEGIPEDPDLSVIKLDGTLKDYVEPLKYLKNTHKEPLGLPLYLNSAKNFQCLGSRGGGKDLEENTLVYTENGPIPIKDINVGDKVYGADGKLTNILSKTEYKDQLQYKITFADGREIECGGGHLWTLIKNSGKKFTTELKNIKDNYLGYQRPNGKRDTKYFVQQQEAINYPNKDLPIDPYYLGLWLAYGNSHNTGITTEDVEIKDYVYKIAEQYDLHVQVNENSSKTCPTYCINSYKNQNKHLGKNTNPLKNQLRELNVLNNKHIPEIYKYSSIEQRLELLKGYMDGDGYSDEKHVESTSKLKVLSEDVQSLAHSLGIKTLFTVKMVNGKPYYRVTYKPNFPIFNLERKKGYWKTPFTKYKKSKINKNGIVSIESTSVKPSVCIGVDNTDSLFLAGDHIVTHNSYYMSVGEVLHALSVDSAKYYTKDSIEFPAKVEICLGSGDTDKSGEFMSKIVECMNEFASNKDTGVWGKFGEEDYMPNVFYKDMQGQTKAGNKEKPWEHKYKKKVKGRWVDGFGSGSKVYHVSYSSNKKSGAEAGAGGRYVLSMVEECGLTSNLIEAYNSNVATVTTDGEQFGVQVFLGTSGNIDLIQPSKEMFTSPHDYNLVTYDDQWEHTGKIGFFLPAYMTFTDKYRDAQGNIKLEEAKNHFNVRREKAAKASNPKTLRVEKMNYPMVPSDMWVSDRGYYLPYEEAAEQEKNLMSGKKYLKLAKTVKLSWANEKAQEVKYDIVHDQEFFTDFPIRKDLESLDGSVVIYEFPINIAGVLPDDAYRFTHDPYVSDNIDEGESLGVTHVWLAPKYWDKYLVSSPLVATYIGKPSGGKKEYYNNLEKLIALYGNPPRGLWYEANRGEFCRGYFAKRSKLHLLCLRPKYEKGTQIYDQKITQYGVIVGNKDSKITMLDDTHDWLLEDIDTLSGKQKIISTIPCIHTMRQIMAFNLDGNFDAVSSVIINPLAIREESHTLEYELKKKAKKNQLAFLSQNNRMFKELDPNVKARNYLNKYDTEEWKNNNVR